MITFLVLTGLFFGNVYQYNEQYEHCVRWEFVDKGCKSFQPEYDQATYKRKVLKGLK